MNVCRFRILEDLIINYSKVNKIYSHQRFGKQLVALNFYEFCGAEMYLIQKKKNNFKT